MEPYLRLAELVTQAPGRSARRNALEILHQLAASGDHQAQHALTGLLATELGLSVEAPLARIYQLGFEPARMLAELDTWQGVAHQVDEDLTAFQALVRRHAPIEDDVLKAYVLTAFVFSFGSELSFGMMADSARLAVLDQILGQARVVPGDAADHSFEFGRDFLLNRADLRSLLGVITHELGHHIFDAARSERGGESQPLAVDARLLGEVARILPQLLQAATTTSGRIESADDGRLRRLPQGLSIICSYEHQPRGDYLHMSLTDAGGPIEPSTALPVAYRVIRLLGCDPAQAAAAMSSRGVFHFGIRGPLPPSTMIRQRARPVLGAVIAHDAQDWFDQLRATHRVGTSEGDLRYLLAVADRPAVVHAEDPRTAWNDQDVCDDIEAGADLAGGPPGALIELLRLTVRCARPDSVARVLAEGRRTGVVPGSDQEDPHLGELGISGCVLRDASVVEYRGAGVEDLWTTLRRLAEAGFGLDAVVTEDGQTLLTDAAARHRADLGRRLLDLGVSVDAPSQDGETALIIATRVQDLDAVRSLLAAGAAPGAQDGGGLTALHHAAWTGSAELVTLLLAAGVETRARNGRTPLMYTRTAATLERLLQAGADVGARDHARATALITAASRCDVAVISGLLAAGADPQAATDRGETALHLAAQAPARLGAREAIEALLAAGAEIDEETDAGMTPLSWAVLANDPDVVELLLERGADANLTDPDGLRPLHLAAHGRRRVPRGELDFGGRAERCVRLLMQKGHAEIDATDAEGETALMLATLGFDSTPVQVLLAFGADPNIVSRHGRTALMNAEAQGHADMIERLRAAGATP